MSKAATIASLVRIAAKTEAEFIETVAHVMGDGDAARAAEFFDRLNIPRSVGLDEGMKPNAAVKKIAVDASTVTTWLEERDVQAGIQKYLDRHERKIKWHASHPSVEGVQNVLLLFRCAIAVTDMRMARLELLLKKHDELNPVEWAVARELLNRTYLTYRNYLHALSSEWVDATIATIGKGDVGAAMGDFYELVDKAVRSLEDARERIEERRQKLTVVPGDPFPPVKPPNYFGGDLLGKGPWKQFWGGVQNRAHHFREAVG